jgi:hypothetical protein
VDQLLIEQRTAHGGEADARRCVPEAPRKVAVGYVRTLAIQALPLPAIVRRQVE